MEIEPQRIPTVDHSDTYSFGELTDYINFNIESLMHDIAELMLCKKGRDLYFKVRSIIEKMDEIVKTCDEDDGSNAEKYETECEAFVASFNLSFFEEIEMLNQLCCHDKIPEVSEIVYLENSILRKMHEVRFSKKLAEDFYTKEEDEEE